MLGTGLGTCVNEIFSFFSSPDRQVVYLVWQMKKLRLKRASQFVCSWKELRQSMSPFNSQIPLPTPPIQLGIEQWFPWLSRPSPLLVSLTGVSLACRVLPNSLTCFYSPCLLPSQFDRCLLCSEMTWLCRSGLHTAMVLLLFLGLWAIDI